MLLLMCRLLKVLLERYVPDNASPVPTKEVKRVSAVTHWYSNDYCCVLGLVQPSGGGTGGLGGLLPPPEVKILFFLEKC
jgi:hypothetical protein